MSPLGSSEEEKPEERSADVSPSGSGEEEKAEERNADPPPSSLQVPTQAFYCNHAQ